MVSIQVVLLVSIYCVAATSNGVVTRRDLENDVENTICLGFFERVGRYFEFCAEDGVSAKMCASKFLW